MIEILQVLVLGLVQGITELFPISSSLHVLLVERFFASPLRDPQTCATLIQLGSSCALLLRFKTDIKGLLLGLFHKEKESCAYTLSLLVAFLPAVIIGVLFHSFIKSICFSTSSAAFALILGGIIFILINPISSCLREQTPTKKMGLLIGLFQILSFIPGVSRLGSTLIGGTCAGLSRQAALRFSFLLAIPILFGAGFWECVKMSSSVSLSTCTYLLPGFITAFLGTYALFPLVFRYLSEKGFFAVGVYRIALGVFLLI